MTPHLILNVDSREISRFARTTVLQEAGYRAIEAGNARSALDLYQAERPHVVLLDIHLPDVSGLELCRSLRVLDRDGSIVIAGIPATPTQTSDQVAALTNGAHACLIEP